MIFGNLMEETANKKFDYALRAVGGNQKKKKKNRKKERERERNRRIDVVALTLAVGS